MPVSLPARMLVFDAGAAAQLQRGELGAFLVGQKARVAVAVLIEDLKLCARVRALAPAHQPRALGPRRQVDAVAQLGDPRPVAVASVGVDRLCPRAFGQLDDRLANRVVDHSRPRSGSWRHGRRR
jgi:hypothetical protein